MRINLPDRVRAAIYIFTTVATPVIGYLFAREIIGKLEVALWSAEVTAVMTMAALNVTVND